MTQDGARQQGWQALFVCVFLAALVLAVFGQTAHFDFVGYDDQLYVFANPVVERGLNSQSVKWAFTHPQVSNWIPLTTLSHMVDCQLFGLRAGDHHLVNVLWHTANTVLLFLVLWRMTGSLWRSAFVAALFAVHPLRAESVAWVSERKDVLSGFFFMLAIGAYVRYARKAAHAWYLAVVLLFALGLMAKGMVATLPFVLLLLDYWPLGRLNNGSDFFRLVREKVPLFAVSAASCIATALTPGLIVRGQVPIWTRLGNALVSYVVYLREMVFPVGLAAHYPIATTGQPLWKAGAAILLLGAITAGALAWRKTRPCLLMGWLWYLGMLFPVIGIVQISSDAAHADRYTYLPEIGLAIAGIWALADWSAKWRNREVILGCAMAGVIFTLTVCGHRQTGFWRNDEALWSHTLACTSDSKGNDFNSVAHNGLGNALSAKGKKDEAIAHYRRAIEIAPGYKVAHYNLGIALMDQGKKDEAVAQYQIALEIDRDYAEAHNNLGVACVALNMSDKAIVEYQIALKINPDYAEARYNLANALLQFGNRDGAIGQYRKALETTPDDPRILNNLGIALATKGQNAEAIALYGKALAIKPDFLDGNYDLAVALTQTGKLDEAIARYRKTLEIDPSYTKARNGIGKALLRKGDFEGAIASFQKTNAMNPNSLETWLNLGHYLLRDGDFEEAIICYHQATRIDGGSSSAYANLGLASLRYGQPKEAIAAWQQALEINPNDINAAKDLAWLLATSPDTAVRNGEKATALAEQANQLSGDGNPMILRTLAAAYAEAGRFSDATATATHAMELAAAQKNEALTAKLSREVKLYEANAPIRDAAR